MVNSIRVPGDLDVPTRFFGAFTPGDLVRLTAPVLAAALSLYPSPTLSAGALATLAVAGLAGVAWYGLTPYGRHLDGHLYHAGRWLVGKRSLVGQDVEEVTQDAVITDEGVAVGVIEVSPVNLGMKSSAEQGALHSIYQQLFQTVTYPVAVYSRQQPLDLTAYAQHVSQQQSPHDDLQSDYLKYCRRLATQELTTTRHFVVLRVDQQSLHWLQERLPDWLPIDVGTGQDAGEAAISELDSRCREVVETLTTGDLTADRLTGRDLEDVVSDVQRHNPKTGATWTTRPDKTRGEYRQTFAITEFPAAVDLGWPLQLLRTDGLVDVCQVVRPRNSASTARTLQRLSEKLNAEIESVLRAGYRGTNKLEGLLEDTEWLLDLLADREDRPVDYAAYVTAHARSRETCEQTAEQVRNRLQTMQIQARRPVLRTDQAYYMDSPLYGDRLDQASLMPAGSAAAGFPFATQEAIQDAGVIYGVDTGDETPVLLDRFAWASHSMVRMGMVGSGKSYAAKLELLRATLAYDDLQLIVVDPKREYGHVVRTLNGTVHTIGPDADYPLDDPVVGFQVAERGQQATVAHLVDLVQQIYAATAQHRRKTLVLIDEARILMNDEAGRQVLNRFVLEGRDTNTAITLVTQNASHFTYCREGREILDNVPGKVFMRHDRVPDDVVDYFGLSQRETQELYELKTGTDAEYSEALLKISGRLDTRIRIDATGQEHAVIQAGEGA